MRTILAFLLSLCLVGCVGTVTPKLVFPETPSPGAVKWDSGVTWAGDKDGVVHGYLDADSHNRYNGLILTYGKGLAWLPTVPPLAKDYGLTVEGQQWEMSDSAAYWFYKMSIWKVNAWPPAK